jgi:hypothetical protein
MNAGAGGDEDGPQDPGVDITLSDEELDALFSEMVRVFQNAFESRRLLSRIGYPTDAIPTFQGNHRDAWSEVFIGFDTGRLATPYRRLILGALSTYQANPVLLRLGRQHGLVAPDGTPVPAPATTPTVPEPDQAVPAPAAPATVPTCHVIVSADSEEDRQRALAQLSQLGLEPQEAWATGTAISFMVNSADSGHVRALLDTTELGWTVVPAGQPDYVFRTLTMEGPDRRRFRITDAPAQQTFRNITEDFLAEHYPRPGSAEPLPTVIDHLREGERHSVNPDETLHEAGVQDGDELRVGYQTNAGSVHPQVHENALYRARNQIRDYATSAAARQVGFAVRANASLALLPTEYELAFAQRSYGIPAGAAEGSDPVEVERHVVSLQLGPDFPQTPPYLWWLTPIFHPNIYPNYDSPPARRRPGARGLVCLGAIGESWQPALDFGDLCRTLVDIAGFRNYSLFELVDTDDGPQLKGNFYDERAAWWVAHNGALVDAIGGKILFRPVRDRPTYRNTIEEVV